MRIFMVAKNELTPAQLAFIDERLSLPEHKDDLGPSTVWRVFSSGMFAYFQVNTSKLVALVDASGDDYVRPGWWIDIAFRGKGFGNDVIDLLAGNLKARGVKNLGPITITTHRGENDQQSIKLRQRLKSYFP